MHINSGISLFPYYVFMNKKIVENNWKKIFLDALLSGTEIIVNQVPQDFEESFHEALKTLPERTSYILIKHFADGMSYEKIGSQLGVTRAATWKASKEALFLLRRTSNIYALAYGKEYKELFDLIKANEEIMNVLQAKNSLLNIFKDITQANDVKIAGLELDNRTKDVFKALGIDNAEELLSFSLKDYIMLAGAVIGDKDAKEKLEKYRTSHEYARCLSVDEVGLSNRSVNCLHRNGVLTLGDICQHTYTELKGFRFLGEQSLDEVMKKLKEYNLKLKI